jgi:hypothetical protein
VPLFLTFDLILSILIHLGQEHPAPGAVSPDVSPCSGAVRVGGARGLSAAVSPACARPCEQPGGGPLGSAATSSAHATGCGGPAPVSVSGEDRGGLLRAAETDDDTRRKSPHSGVKREWEVSMGVLYLQPVTPSVSRAAADAYHRAGSGPVSEVGRRGVSRDNPNNPDKLNRLAAAAAMPCESARRIIRATSCPTARQPGAGCVAPTPRA